MADLLDVRVRSRRLVGSTAILEIEASDRSVLPPFTAGAHVDVHLGGGLIRQYSLCNAPDEADCYRLGVLLDPLSRGGSAAVHETLVEGHELRIGLPRNNFPLAEQAKRSILMAGGIGITPLIAMAWRLYRLGFDFELHYCARTLELASFANELAGTPFADKVAVHIDDLGLDQQLDVAAVLARPDPGTHLYVCGPGGFMDYVVAKADALGWDAAQIHLERFSVVVDESGAAFTVVAAHSGVECLVPDGTTIVQALAKVGITIPMSCEQGICGTCVTPVLEGLPDHRDQWLMDDEKAANDVITPCCSRSLTPRLVLDI